MPCDRPTRFGGRSSIGFATDRAARTRIRSCKLGNFRDDADNFGGLGAFGNLGSLENECDARPHHRADRTQKDRDVGYAAQRPGGRSAQSSAHIKTAPGKRPRAPTTYRWSRPSEPTPKSAHHEGRTWMSPTPSVVDFVGGSRSSVAHAGMGARRQMRRHARQLADRVDAAEATSFGAWFCASSSSQSSSPRTSSSIWLSSPYCPPSHKRWRFRNSAVANRHALHSDYYSTMRKTATPLNEWWIAGALAVIAASTVSARATRNDPCDRRARSTRAEISPTREKPCGTRVFGMRADPHRVCANRCAPIGSGLAMTRRRRARRILRPQKNFRSGPPASRAGRKIPIERAESRH
jgi:hypothetical protein